MVKIEETEGNGGGGQASHPRRYYSAKSFYPPQQPSSLPSSSSNQPQSRRTFYQAPSLPSYTYSPSPPPPDSPCSSTYESLNGGPSPQHDPNLFPSSSPILPANPPNNPQPSQSRAVFNLLIRNEPPPVVTKTETYAVTGFSDEGGSSSRDRSVRVAGGRGTAQQQQQQQQPGGRRRSVSGAGSEKVARKAAFALRVFGLVVCLISFSVMLSDKNRGWALDSFDRYKEFRYSMYVNAIGFAYSALQIITLLTTKNGSNKTQFLYYLDFMLDQMLAYLLVSASSSAATRVDDWILNWGKDEFPTMASVSIVTSFVGFLVFALSSLCSGYLLYCCVHA